MPKYVKKSTALFDNFIQLSDYFFRSVKIVSLFGKYIFKKSCREFDNIILFLIVVIECFKRITSASSETAVSAMAGCPISKNQIEIAQQQANIIRRAGLFINTCYGFWPIIKRCGIGGGK